MKKDGSLRTGLAGRFRKVAGSRYTIAALEKRGVKLGDGQRGTGTNCTDEYHKHTGLEARRSDHLLAIKALKQFHPRVVVVGHSEGTDVASAVAAASQDVHRLGFLSGGGATQAFDFFVMVRKQMRGKDPAMVEAAITGLIEQLEDVYRYPNSDKKMLFGHPYSRWSSYFKHAPVESLLKVTVPIFMAHGAADTSVPIESADYIAADFMRHGKKNLTYRRYAGLDHSFYACRPMTEGCDRGKGNKFSVVIADFLRWVETPAEQLRRRKTFRAAVGHCLLVAKDRSVFAELRMPLYLSRYRGTERIEAIASAKEPCKIVVLEREPFDWAKVEGLDGIDGQTVNLLLKEGRPFVTTGTIKGHRFFLLGITGDKRNRGEYLRQLAETPYDLVKPGAVIKMTKSVQ